jgi:hypothetical protein
MGLAAPWELAAFGLGAIASDWRRAVLSAMLANVTGIAIYYAWMQVFEGGVNLSYLLSLTAFWLLLAPVAGLGFGLAGWLWRNRRIHWLVRTLAVALPAGLIAGESTFMALTARTLTSGELTLLSAMITGGIMMPLVLLREMRERLAGVGLTGVFLLSGLATVPLLRWVIQGLEQT